MLVFLLFFVPLLAEPITIAYFGDLGLTENSSALLKMIKEEKGVQLVVQSGDFDYTNNATAFGNFLDTHLGIGFPYIAAAGNHDVPDWAEYRQVLLRKISQAGAGLVCKGNVPDNYYCTMHGVFIAVSAIGVLDNDFVGNSMTLENYMNLSHSVLAGDVENSTWKVCAWHKNQYLTQIGDKPDEASWNPYEICRRHGGMIATAHEHSYARSHIITKFDGAGLTVGNTKSPYEIKKGETLFFSNGLGGKSIRPSVGSLKELPQWGSTAAEEDGVTAAAVFCTYHYEGDPDRARCYTKDIFKGIIDEWEMKSSGNGEVSPYVFQQPPLSRRQLVLLACGAIASILAYVAIFVFFYLKCYQ